MSAFTLRYSPVPSDAVVRALEECARRDGFRVSWQHNAAYERSYALLESRSANIGDHVLHGATRFDSAIIALALRPNVAEALPLLADALGGPGRPAGVAGCERVGDAVVVEWNLDRTPARMIRALVDVELARFGAGCVNDLLSPLPLAWWTAIARDGLHAPEIAPNRVLEALIEEHHVAS